MIPRIIRSIFELALDVAKLTPDVALEKTHFIKKKKCLEVLQNTTYRYGIFKNNP